MTELTAEAIEKFVAEPKSMMYDGATNGDCSALYEALKKAGWKNYKSSSVCSKATFDVWLQKDGKKINIVAAYFMGRFADVRVGTYK